MEQVITALFCGVVYVKAIDPTLDVWFIPFTLQIKTVGDAV